MNIVTFIRKKVENYGKTRHATDDNIIWHMRFARWVTKARDTHSEFIKFIVFRNQRL
jgi:hypothetical protein